MEFAQKGVIFSEKYWRIEAKNERKNQNNELLLLENTQERESKNQSTVLSEAKCRKYSRDLVQAIDFIHQVLRMSHLNIKPSNLFITEDDTLKLGEFLENSLLKNCSKSCFLAPEIKNSKKQTLWSF